MAFKKFEKNIQSQFGEDGVINEIFKRIGLKSKVCVEFGAWDGIHLSNTWNLWANEQWDAILIEGDSDKFTTLSKNVQHLSNVSALNAFVTSSGQNSLDEILSRINPQLGIDLLSIDIDGDDYYVFEGLKKYRPRLIIVEYNPTIPAHLNIVQNKGEYFGCSALALYKLGNSKNYELIHMTDTNMFFIDSSEFNKLKIETQQLDELFPKKHLTNVFTSYNGTPFISGKPVYMADIKSEKGKRVKLPFVQQNNPDVMAITIAKKEVKND